MSIVAKKDAAFHCKSLISHVLVWSSNCIGGSGGYSDMNFRAVERRG
jgi:hypothetical protein